DNGKAAPLGRPFTSGMAPYARNAAREKITSGRTGWNARNGEPGRIAKIFRLDHQDDGQQGRDPFHEPGETARESEDQQADGRQGDHMAEFLVEIQGRLTREEPEPDERDLNQEGHDDSPSEDQVGDPQTV